MLDLVLAYRLVVFVSLVCVLFLYRRRRSRVYVIKAYAVLSPLLASLATRCVQESDMSH